MLDSRHGVQQLGPRPPFSTGFQTAAGCRSRLRCGGLSRPFDPFAGRGLAHAPQATIRLYAGGAVIDRQRGSRDLPSSGDGARHGRPPAPRRGGRGAPASRSSPWRRGGTAPRRGESSHGQTGLLRPATIPALCRWSGDWTPETNGRHRPFRRRRFPCRACRPQLSQNREEEPVKEPVRPNHSTPHHPLGAAP